MLVRKNKTNKSKKDINSKDSINSMRSWVRKIEQSTNSVSSRLAAVEKRISQRNSDSLNYPLPKNILEGPIEQVFSELKDKKNIKKTEEVARLLDSEFYIMQEELINQKNEILLYAEEFKKLKDSLGEIKTEIENLRKSNTQISQEINFRLENIERREPPIMKIGNMEIPIEFSGVIGGLLAFFIAILVIAGQKDIILSPVFLSIVGVLLISSALFKTINLGSKVNRIYTKTNKIEDSS